MTKTIKLGLLLPKVCDGSSGIKCYREGKEIEHPHPMVRWRAGGEIVVLKRWKLEEILDPNGPINDSKFWNFRKKPFLMGPFSWCSPSWFLEEAGFVHEGNIDIKILFGDYLEKDVVHKDGIVRAPFTYVPWTWRDLRKVRVQLEEELDKFGYKDRDLIIYRTIKASLSNWDFIEVFSEKRVPVGV